MMRTIAVLAATISLLACAADEPRQEPVRHVDTQLQSQYHPHQPPPPNTDPVQKIDEIKTQLHQLNDRIPWEQGQH